MMRAAIVLAMISVLTGCVTTSHSVPQRDVARIAMGQTVDGRDTRIIKDGNQVLPVSEVFDPIMKEAGFELNRRDRSYGLSPHTGTTYTSDYGLTGRAYSGFVRCLTIVDTKSVSISFRVVASGHNKKDFPPSEEVRALAARVRPEIMKVLSSRFPDRAIQVTDVYWEDK
jgi:hypothetical protein